MVESLQIEGCVYIMIVYRQVLLSWGASAATDTKAHQSASRWHCRDLRDGPLLNGHPRPSTHATVWHCRDLRDGPLLNGHPRPSTHATVWQCRDLRDGPLYMPLSNTAGISGKDHYWIATQDLLHMPLSDTAGISGMDRYMLLSDTAGISGMDRYTCHYLTLQGSQRWTIIHATVWYCRDLRDGPLYMPLSDTAGIAGMDH